MNIAAVLRETATRIPDKVALIEHGGRAFSYAELDAETDRVAAGFRQRGVAHGDRVAIALGNVAEFVTSYLGALRIGAIAVPLNITLTASEVAGIVEDSAPKVIVIPAGSEAAFADLGGSTEILSLSEWDGLAQPGAKGPEAEVEDDDVAVLAYTSGTTGKPKGAMLTHGNLFANLQQQMAIPADTVGEDDVLFLTLPLFHIFGLNVPLGLLVLNGATGILVERFEPVESLRLIEQHGVTVLFGAPPMYVAWVNTPGADQYDLSSVRLAISGAAALPEETLKGFEAIFGVTIFEGYGLTETAPTLTTNRMAESPRARSIGKPLPGVELRLVDEDFGDVELGDPGEVVVRGPNVFKGYWNKEAETAEVFRDGWFKTGDVAVRDEEGYLYLVDRKRDLIIVSGFNVFPSEVEDALVAHDAVRQAAVVGDAHPYTGETVKAFVVLEDGASMTEEGLQAFMLERLARFKCPTSIEFVDTLPQMPTGKVLRRALRT